MWASSNGHKEVAELLLEKGADVNAKNVLSARSCSFFVVGCSAHLDCYRNMDRQR